MVSREEAKEAIYCDYSLKNKENEKLINTIYDSIGSCGECKYYRYEDLSDGTFRAGCNKDIIFFKRLKSVNECTCKHFERKEQCGT